MERVRERGGYLETSTSKLAAASQANLGTSVYLADCVAQRDEIVTGDAKHGYTEEPVPFPAVTDTPLQVGVPEAVAATPAHEETVSLFLPRESFPGGLTGHSECFTDPCPADPSLPECRYVVSHSTIHVLVSGVGSYHLLQQPVIG